MVPMAFSAAFPVTFLIDVIVVEVARLFLGLTLHDIGKRPHLHVPAVFFAREFAVGVDVALAFVELVLWKRHVGDVAVLGGEVPAALGATGIHQRRIGLLDRLGLQVALLDLVVLADVIEFFVLGPQPPDDRQPFLGAFEPLVMFEQRITEHVDFGLVPAGDDVEAKRPLVMWSMTVDCLAVTIG